MGNEQLGIPRNLKRIVVTTPFQAQFVRAIRNTVKEFMTQNTTFITSEQQAIWFDKHASSGNKLFLYVDKFEAVVGYGYLRLGDDHKIWGTLAVLPEFHNTGYGTEIYQDLIKNAGVVWIEIYTDNNPSLVAALKSGFKITSINDKTIVLRAEKAE